MLPPYRKTTYRGYSSVGRSRYQKLFDIDLVKQDLLNHFNTRKNERVRDATYGTIIQDLLFEHKVNKNKDAIVNEAIRVINAETRVAIISYTVTEDAYSISIDFDLFYIGLEVKDTFRVNFDIKNGIAKIVDGNN